MASVRLLSESGHGLPRVGAVVDARLGERLVRVRVRVRDRDGDRDRGLGFGSELVSASERRKRIEGGVGEIKGRSRGALGEITRASEMRKRIEGRCRGDEGEL